MTTPSAISSAPLPSADRCLPISRWYEDLAAHTFPTVFIGLTLGEAEALAAGDSDSSNLTGLAERLSLAIDSLPGACFVHADVCAPSDAPDFTRSHGKVRTGPQAVKLLASSPKVRQALSSGLTRRLGVHPYRRMDRVREFRLFIYEGKLRAASQMALERHYARLAGRAELVWQRAQELSQAIMPFLPVASLAADVYLTSAGKLMLIDLNPWGAPTLPLLWRTWDQDWNRELGLRLIPKPIKMGGDVSVSF